MSAVNVIGNCVMLALQKNAWIAEKMYATIALGKYGEISSNNFA
jgi:hypothetical protein